MRYPVAALVLSLLALLTRCAQLALPAVPFSADLTGAYDNFQQVWQEQTQNAKHQVTTATPHRAVHARVSSTQWNNRPALYIRLAPTYDTTQLLWHTLYVAQNTQNLLAFDLSPQQTLPAADAQPTRTSSFLMKPTGLTIEDAGRKLRLKQDTLQLFGLSSSTDAPLRLLRCRYFKGWMEIPHPDFPDSTWRYPNLRLHDQGGRVQLRLPNGQPGEYSVELTQLVYGQQIPIMKLAVYKLPAAQLDYNSYAAAYTWATPEAQRIGINLRYLTTGWTLESSGLPVSKN